MKANPEATDSSPVSTGQLPPSEQVRRLLCAAHERFKSNDDGHNADYYPALAEVPRHLFGVCVAGVGGGIITVAPGKGGMGTFAPPLDNAGNSVKGQLAARFLSERLGLHLFASKPAQQ